MGFIDTKVEIVVTTKTKGDFLGFFEDLIKFVGNHDVIMLVREIDFSKS